MKRKIIKTTLTALAIAGAFFIGKISCYNPDNYVVFDEIADVECDGRGNVNIITNDGNVYTLFVTGEY